MWKKFSGTTVYSKNVITFPKRAVPWLIQPWRLSGCVVGGQKLGGSTQKSNLADSSVLVSVVDTDIVVSNHSLWQRRPAWNTWSAVRSNHLQMWQPNTAVTPAVQLLQIQEEHASGGTFQCMQFLPFFYPFFIPVLSRSYFTSKTSDKDQKIEQLFYFRLVQVP